MPRIEVTTEISAPPEACFDCARDLDLHMESMARTGERAVAGRISGLIELGEEVTWRARHFCIQHEQSAKITQFSRPTHFRDEMTRGRFKRFVHDHFFEPTASGTCMRDSITFNSPLGPIGWVLDALLLRRYLQRLLVERNQAVRQAAEAGAHSARAC